MDDADRIARVLIWSGQHRGWWRANRSGYTRDRAAAGVYGREEAEHILAGVGPEKRLRLIAAQPGEGGVEK